MTYFTGQRINLWQIKNDFEVKTLKILKSVLVTVLEAKVGVPYEFSRRPCDMQSLLAIGDDGSVYEKHWDYWPESQTQDFSSQWSWRDDGIDGKLWLPAEAVYVFNDIWTYNYKRPNRIIRLVSRNDEAVIPLGDVEHCEVHGNFFHKGKVCFSCTAEELKARRKLA